MRKLHSKLVRGGSISGKINSLSYKSLELKCFLHPVHSKEAERSAVEKRFCAEVYGEEVHMSHGMNSKQISSFHYRNSYNLINAVWMYTCDTCLGCTFEVGCSCTDRASSASLKIPNISLGCHLHLQCLLSPSPLGTVRNGSEPHKIHLSQIPSGKVMSSSAILLLHATAVVCCTWPLYRPQMSFLFLFIFLLN